MKLRDWLMAAGTVTLLITGAAAGAVSWELANTLRSWARVPEEIAAVRAAVVALPGAVLPPVLARVDAIERDADRRIGQAIAATDARMGEALAALDGRVGVALETAAAAERDANARIVEMNGTLDGLAGSVTGLVDTYAAIPARVEMGLRPSWAAIEPEITCRLANGAGYGGCTHGRLNAVLGEAARVGGVFTQHFPSLVTSWDGTAKSWGGISADLHTLTTRATAPKNFWGKFRDGAVTGSVLVRAFGSAGIF